MLKTISTTTATYPLAQPTGRNLHKVSSGQYAGRMVAVIKTTTGELKYSWADRPYHSWSTLTTIATDAGSLPATSLMDADSGIHVVYSDGSSGALVTRKLTFSEGTWTIGSKVTIYSGAAVKNPSVGVEPGGKLWISFSNNSAGSWYIHVKSSTDSGVTWGSGPSDTGDILTTGASIAHSKVVIAANDVYVVYVDGTTKIAERSVPIGGGSWTSEEVIQSTTSLDGHFDAAVSMDGLLGVVFDDGAIRYRQYDGNLWGGVILVDSDGGTFPKLIFNGNVPIIIYLSPYATDQSLMKYSHRYSGNFSTPEVLDPAAGLFDGVHLYNQASASYSDKTLAASSGGAADIFHPDSSVMMKEVGDALYLGMDHKFRYAKMLLSSTGAGGTVGYAYFDGTTFKAFSPCDGVYMLDAADKDLELFDDYLDMPEDWQQCSINSEMRYWVRVEVQSAFSTGPVGSQITAIPDIQRFDMRR